MPYLHAALLADIETVETAHDLEHAGYNFGFRQIRAQVFLRNGVLLLPQFLRVIRHVPGFERDHAVLFAREAFEFLELLLRRRAGAAREVAQELHNLGNALGHARLQRVFRIVRITQQRRGLGAQLQYRWNQFAVVPATGMRPGLGGACHERLVHLPAQLTLVGVGHKRNIRRTFECEAPAGLALLLRRLLRHRARGRPADRRGWLRS